MRTNFRKIIKELQKIGFSKADLARECQCTPTYITQLAKGHRKQPNYDIGKCMVDLLEAS